MSAGIASIEVSNISREFSSEKGRRTMLELLHGKRRTEAQPKVALKDISLTIEQGEKIALIGDNAAGKSTLLKIIAGLLRPSEGEVRVKGKMILLTALGLGMIEELTIEENLVLYGAFYGLDRKRVCALIPEILEWARMEQYRGAKLKTLSSGMRARLAFSVVRHMETDVFLLDEALSAGDAGFRERCGHFFRSSKNHQRTFVIASHDLDFVRSFCTRAVWLCEGSVAAIGKSGPIVDAYLQASGLANQNPALGSNHV
jgi:ABC-2 type transport system ATP-binding protein